jgi:hypothetical protein
VVEKSKPYGPHIKIEKLECVGHIWLHETQW